MVERINSCLEYQKIKPPSVIGQKQEGIKLTVSEVNTSDDYESTGYKGFNNAGRGSADITNWAKETGSLAKQSIFCHLTEIPLKIISYFLKDKENWWSKAFFMLERVADTGGGYKRNKIYDHEYTDKNGKKQKDDNIGAEDPANNKTGDTTTYKISKLNNFLQTIGRPLIPILGLISPKLANDIDWGFFHTIDSIRWKRAASNNGFYPGFLQDIVNSLFKKEKLAGLSEIWKFVKSKLSNNISVAKGCFQNLSLPNNKIKFYKQLDEISSTFLSLSQWPNMLGDILRPIARRLNMSGFTRNIIRTLSVIDRPFVWLNYLFRFHLPERLREEKHKENFRFSNLFPLVVAGDILDVTSTILEDKVKESSNWLQHTLNIAGILKGSLLKIFFSGRRKRISEEN